MMHNDVSSTKKTSLDQARSLNVELGLDFGLIPSKKVEPKPGWASNICFIKAPIFLALLKMSSLVRAWALPNSSLYVQNSIVPKGGCLIFCNKTSIGFSMSSDMVKSAHSIDS